MVENIKSYYGHSKILLNVSMSTCYYMAVETGYAEGNELNIAFVCTGNTCRSPMAEYIFKDMVEKENLPYNVYSRGLFARENAPANIEAISAVARYDESIDMSSHHAHNIVLEDIYFTDIILTMSETHKDILKRRISKTKVLQDYDDLPEIYTLKEFAQLDNPEFEDLDIADPYDKILSINYRIYQAADNCKFLHTFADSFLKAWGTFYKKYPKAKFLPDFFPFKQYKEKVYDKTRDEIVDQLDLVIEELEKQ